MKECPHCLRSLEKRPRIFTNFNVTLELFHTIEIKILINVTREYKYRRIEFKVRLCRSLSSFADKSKRERNAYFLLQEKHAFEYYSLKESIVYLTLSSSFAAKEGGIAFETGYTVVILFCDSY